MFLFLLCTVFFVILTLEPVAHTVESFRINPAFGTYSYSYVLRSFGPYSFRTPNSAKVTVHNAMDLFQKMIVAICYF